MKKNMNIFYKYLLVLLPMVIALTAGAQTLDLAISNSSASGTNVVTLTATASGGSFGTALPWNSFQIWFKVPKSATIEAPVTDANTLSASASITNGSSTFTALGEVDGFSQSTSSLSIVDKIAIGLADDGYWYFSVVSSTPGGNMALADGASKILYTFNLPGIWHCNPACLSILTGDEPDFNSKGFSTAPNVLYNNINVLNVTTASAILPVVLTTFTAVGNFCNANLAWASASELNSSYYAVEQSSDGHHFSQVGKVVSKNFATGAGYSYTASLNAGINYFRLRMVDFDGNLTYSSIVTATGTGSCSTSGVSIKVSPNPTSNLLFIQGIANGSQIALLGSSGEKLIEVTASGTSQTLNLSSYAKGVYVVRILLTDGSINNIKVVKQ